MMLSPPRPMSKQRTAHKNGDYWNLAGGKSGGIDTVGMPLLQYTR